METVVEWVKLIGSIILMGIVLISYMVIVVSILDTNAVVNRIEKKIDELLKNQQP